MKAKLVSRGIVAILRYMDAFPVRNSNGAITLCTPFKTVNNAHVHIQVQPHQVREMLEGYSPLDLSMSDRIVLYRLEPYHYHITFEGIEAIEV